tara:strand:+ start:49937 stop:50581 length:645 start_codon:yes stop_codon:yes gene_type:complete
MKKVGTTTNDSFIGMWDNVFTKEECEVTVRHLDKVFTNSPELLHTENRPGRKDLAMFVQDKAPTIEVGRKIVERLIPCWEHYCSAYGLDGFTGRFHELFCQGIKVQKSITNGGYCDWHFEQGTGPGSPERFAVWMMYLNEDFEGGNTEFMHQELAVKPEAGKLLIWPASYTHNHRAAANLVGTKWIATGWFSYQKESMWIPKDNLPKDYVPRAQ